MGIIGLAKSRVVCKALRTQGVWNDVLIGQVPTNAEWAQMEAALYEAHPRFRDFMHEHRLQLTDKAHKTCLLIRMGFKPAAISHMLGTSVAYISIMRSELMQELFGASGPLRDFDKRIQEIG